MNRKKNNTSYVINNNNITFKWAFIEWAEVGFSVFYNAIESSTCVHCEHEVYTFPYFRTLAIVCTFSSQIVCCLKYVNIQRSDLLLAVFSSYPCKRGHEMMCKKTQLMPFVICIVRKYLNYVAMKSQLC